MKLTTLTTWPPEGWIYRDPKTGYVEPMPKSNNFLQVAQGIQKARTNNKGIYNASERTLEAAKEALEQFTVWRLARKGVFEQVMLEAGDEEKFATQGVVIKKKQAQWRSGQAGQPQVQPEAAKPAGGLREIVERIKQAGYTLKDWLGEGGENVEQAQADERASVCTTCPLNDTKTSLWDWFTDAAANAIKKQLELKNDMKLVTPNDTKLGVCEACGCQLHLKVWTPLEHIKNNINYDDWLKLDEKCWILKENRSGEGI